MKIPTLDRSLEYIEKAKELNPGSWIDHSIYVAQAAEAIASHHPNLSPEKSLVLGYLHDIGRQEGIHQMRHIIDGYNFLQAAGFDDAARICLTHSFPIQDVNTAVGNWDCSEQEFEFVKSYLSNIEYTEYDRLIQLCDALTLPSGFVLIEKRLIDVSLRYGVNEYSVLRWKAYLNIQRNFEKAIGASIYSLLPGVIENTFRVNVEPK